MGRYTLSLSRFPKNKGNFVGDFTLPSAINHILFLCRKEKCLKGVEMRPKGIGKEDLREIA